MKYEFVSKNVYRPVREDLESIIHKVQKIMKKRCKLTFQYRLIGSGNKHLITRIKGGNKGYDFDYNLILPTLQDGEKYKAKVVKENFIQAVNEAISGTNYSYAEDSTSAITIKVIDRKNNRIIHSCDFGIVYYVDENNRNEGYNYLKNDKQGNYRFEYRNNSKDVEYKIQEIKECYKNGWEVIKYEYLDVKEGNSDINKHSFVLFLEAVNNVYNHLQQEIRKQQQSRFGCGIY